MARYRFIASTSATPEEAFDLWTNLERMHEWVGGVTGVRDVSGPTDREGTRYTTIFGRMSSPTEVIAVERPRLFATRFGNRILRGENRTMFEPHDQGTLITEEFRTQGVIPALMARIFASGSYRGSFQGELNEFARLASAEAARRPT
jgi:hypothetical protein